MKVKSSTSIDGRNKGWHYKLHPYRIGTQHFKVRRKTVVMVWSYEQDREKKDIEVIEIKV